MNGWLPATRVAVSEGPSRLRLRRTRGRIEVNLAHARFVTKRRTKEWRPLAAPTAVTILQSRRPGTTILRVACGDEIAQFVVALPRVDVLLFFTTAVPAPLLQAI